MLEQVRVGVAVFFFNTAGKFLIGKRCGSHGAGTWGLPGGHLEFGETASAAAVREVAEETGLIIDPDSIRRTGWSESVFVAERKHYITVVLAALCRSPLNPILMEPEKCEEWRWVTKKTLPEPLFPPLANYLSHNEVPNLNGEK